ncbi:MAG: prepilin-type N-terminal cleavage/methylation domain-containing protein [Deltaproteobacteria bacterium]|nr:prepilin-type N-terminal cleavage/methylation domain-containing protein [Deltaproteobacteria bacterium]
MKYFPCKYPDREINKGEEGFTLIEILIVIVIMGLIIGSIAFYFKVIPKMRMKESSRKFANAIRFTSNHARTTRLFHRLILDLDAENPSLELEIVPSGETVPDLDPEITEDEEDSITFEEWPEFDPASPIGPTGTDDNSKPFRPRLGGWKKPDKSFMKPVKLEGIHIRRVSFPCIGKEYDSGKVAYYFFPNGQNFGGVIELTSASGARMKMLVHAATGLVQFVDADSDNRNLCFDDDGNNVEKLDNN